MTTLRTMLILSLATTLDAEERRVNYDEAKVGNLPLPALLVAASGSQVTTAEQWTTQRRAEVLEAFRQHVFGRTPEFSKDIKIEALSTRTDALDGLATRKLLRITLPAVPKWQGMDVMIYHPNRTSGPVPVFVGLNFQGNHAVSPENDLPLSTRWMRAGKVESHVVDNHSTEMSRGAESSRWPLKLILQKGCALATAYYGDLEPDHAEGWKDGLRGAVGLQGGDSEWGAIGAWAWGLSRILDVCEKDPALNAKQALCIGHSRLGKTSLWAGAQDERFGVVISNNSGEGGAALARRDFGETTKIITTAFPHWFCARYKTYSEPNTANLPVDAHMLLALAAPRGLYVASAIEDTWADPKGEFLAAKEAGVVFALFGKQGVGVEDWPAVDHPVGNQVRYHMRTGKHDVLDYDWEQYLKFAADLWMR
jgi:hypothetical protein